ncbi:MAG: glutamate racemase [Defluviitaleaceae bacterium]|nr:glutamate racemase [Defluviitaleaceae bacterium]
MNNKPIGIFDSGVGGLTVARQIMRAASSCKLIYFGDSLRAPYGDRRPEELIEFSREIIDFLLSKDIGALVVACGTISATVFDDVRKMVDIPIFGMVEAAVEAALSTTETGRIGLVATAGTVAGRAHEKAIKARRPDAAVKAVACPLFVPLVEEGWLDNDVANAAAKIYLADFADHKIDTLILGCTHYPLLINSIKAAIPADIKIIDPAAKLAENVAKTMTGTGEANPQHEFYVSGNKDKFDKISYIVLGKPCDAQIVAL